MLWCVDTSAWIDALNAESPGDNDDRRVRGRAGMTSIRILVVHEGSRDAADAGPQVLPVGRR